VEVSRQHHEFDAIVVGTGPGGATTARELSKSGMRVLVIERGNENPVKDSLFSLVSVIGAVPIGDKLSTAGAFTVGGTSMIYFGACEPPPIDAFMALGVDLSPFLSEAEAELPIVEIPDNLLGEQSIELRRCAQQLGFPWRKNRMLVDLAKTSGRYRHDAKWTARSYLSEALASGAEMITGAKVTRVIGEAGRAVGVEYRGRSGKQAPSIVRAERIVLAAGATASPMLLRNSGMDHGMDASFYCHPGHMVFGIVPGLDASEGFVATMSAELGDGLAIGDGNFHKTMFLMHMVMNKKFTRVFRYRRSMAIGVVMRERCGGGITNDGKFHKAIETDDRERLAEGVNAAQKVMAHAGGRDIFTSSTMATHVGGSIKIGAYVDENLQTPYRGLYVCDGSVIPDSVKVPPTLTLICLAKRLAKHLSGSDRTPTLLQ
jgi:choline dehydrogenase-like flavoprotein